MIELCRLKESNYKLYSTLAKKIRLTWDFEEFDKLEIIPDVINPDKAIYSGYGYAY